MASDLLSTLRGELDARMRDLRPLMAEYERLVAAAEALGMTDNGSVSTPPITATASRGSRATRTAGAPRRSTSPAERSTSTTPRQSTNPQRKRAPRGAAQKAILAALKHGSHTAPELTHVTAMTAPNIHSNLRRLLKDGTVAKATRDGKTAYSVHAV